MFCAINTIEQKTIIIDVVDQIVVVMPIYTTYQARKEIEIASESFTHVVIELIAIRRCMHNKYRPVKTFPIHLHFSFHIIKIRDRSNVIIFSSICV